MHPLLVLIGLLVGAQVAGVFGALFGIPVLAVLNTFFNYTVNLRTIEETQPADRDVVLEELRQQQPEAAPEELVAMAAEQVDEEEETARVESERAAAEALETEAASGELRAAAGDLRAAAGEQREAAGQMGESATDLREAAGRLADDDPEERS